MANRKKIKFLWIIVFFSIILLKNNQFVYAEDISATNRHLIVNYTRPEADYQNGEDGWRLWVWEDEGDGTDYFGQIENGTLVFDIQISSECKTVGMLLHRTEDGDEWAEKDGDDRFVEFPIGQNVKKVNIKQGELEVADAPDNQGVQEFKTTGEFKFYYRDDNHYYNNTLESLTGKVNVEVDGCIYPMTYDAENKRYVYTMSDLTYDKHYYRYIVDGTIVLDSYNSAQEEYQGEIYSYVQKAYSETEDNGSKAQANVITANQAYNGTLSSGDDIDYYMVNIQNTGYFQLQFKVSENTGDIAYGWNVSLLDKDLNTIKEYTGVEQNFTTAALPMTGDYYIKVEPHDNGWADRVPIGCIYSVCAVTTESDIWENEQNDTQGSASEISVDKAYNGTLHGQYDIDWYKVNVEKNGYFQLQFNVNESDAVNYGWYITIFDKNQNVIKEYDDVTKSFESVKLPHQPGEYYITVEPDDNGWADRVPIDCIYSVCIVTTESDAWEIETNDDKNFANMISVGKSYSGMLYKQHDVDWYKVTVSKKGYFQLQFDVDAQFTADDINYGWKVSVLDNNQNEIAVYTEVGNSFESVKLPHQPGEYYIKVEPDDNGWADRVPIDCIYSICVVNTASNSWEMEGNDNEVSATNISANKAYSGMLYKQEDVDWYKVNVDKIGYFQLKFNADEKTSADDINYGWKVSILDKSQNVIKEYTDIVKEIESIILPYRTGTYYIKVEPADNGWADRVPIDCIYSVCVTTKSASGWEIEGTNDNSSVAATAVNKTVKGVLHNSNDVDWYRFNISNTGYFQLKFDVDKKVIKENIQDGWMITILDKNLKEIKKYEDVKAKMSSAIMPYSKGIYYIKIERQNDYYLDKAPVDCIYSINMVSKASSSFESENNDEKVRADKISLNKEYHGILTSENDEDWYKFTVSSNGKVLLKFSKHSTVASSTVGTGWCVEIYQGTKLIKKYENIKTSFKYTVNLTKGTYYVKVKAQDDWNAKPPVDRRYTVKATFIAKPAASSIKSISTKSKTVTLSWNQSSRATGYYVYRSTSKNGTYRKIATIKNKATVKYTDKYKLKKNARYYYKVVSYTTANGLTVSGNAGNVKVIQVK